ncbi:RHS repeat-associated core domain-containing protein, partial [Streptococcus minor]
GEARDITGLDYLRARYYDHQVGTFLTEDSYQGDDRDPLSQNLYSYVQNNPVNYTDPSGHRAMGLLGGGGRRRKPKPSTKSYPIFPSGTPIEKRLPVINNPQAANALIQQQRKTLQLPQHPTLPAFMGGGPNAFTNITNSFVTSYNSAYQYAQSQTGNAQHSAMTALQAAIYSGESTYNWEKSKSKEGANIHRNWTKALEEQQRHVCIVAGKADGGSQKKVSSFNSSHYASTQDFKNNLMEQYGFNQQTADLMWKLYQNIKDKEGKNADYVFNRLLGGLVYDDSMLNAFKWTGTAGPGSYNLSQAELTIPQQIKAYGLSDKEYQSLFNEVLIQYSNPKGYSDFAHQSITTATLLYGNITRLANGLGVAKGKGTSSHQYINHLSGWLGDITLGSKSIDDADYKADLDAVNITSMMNTQKLDYMTASSIYYDGLKSGKYNRAYEFKSNLGGIATIKKQIYKTAGISESNDEKALRMLKKENSVAYNFIVNLQNNNNNYK